MSVPVIDPGFLGGMVAAGTTQVTAPPLPQNAVICVVATCASGAGICLPGAVTSATLGNEQYPLLGVKYTVMNNGANALLIYPPTACKINALSNNAGYSLAAAASINLVFASLTQVWTM